MKRFLVFAACMLLLLPVTVQASYLHVDSNVVWIASEIGSNNNTPSDQTVGGVFTGTLDGTSLGNIYCADLFTTITIPGNYPDTYTNRIGQIHNGNVHNAAQVAWLLSTFYSAATTDNLKGGLQAAIWHVVWDGYLGHSYAIDPDDAPAAMVAAYNADLAALGSNVGDVSGFLWITPKDGTTEYQGLVAPVPIPAAVWLLGTGLVALIGIRRRKNI